MTVEQQPAGAPPPPRVRIGVLALQGSFREHMALLTRVGGVDAVEVRTKDELEGLSGLVIPGGESTTMAHIAERWGLIPELRAFAARGRPIWGTCAGMIFLAERAEGQKKGGQALLGGLDVCVSRNFFGAQVHSFEAQLPAPPEVLARGGPETFRAVFIRAPAVVDAGPGVQVLAECPVTGAAAEGGRSSVAVAVRQGPLLATAFHPELTSDLRWCGGQGGRSGAELACGAHSVFGGAGAQGAACAASVGIHGVSGCAPRVSC
ncbi:MAG: class I glutamine amidotransferase-like protein [Monoraphidium minutum]|nr:MAG: class I glutamine amidotransferase-like protein [Monoraphidium minutum]